MKIKDAAIFRRNADAARTGRLVAGISATWRAITISGWGTQGNGGNDRYWLTAPLQHGWVLDSTSTEVTVQVNNGGRVSVDGSLTSDPGTSSPRLGVDWYVNNCGAIFYTGHMIVTGPAGVPPF